MKKKDKSSSTSNVMYMLKILWHGSCGYVIYAFIKEFVENVFRTIFSVYLTEWIYKAIGVCLERLAETPRAETVFTPSARIPSRPAGTMQ